MCENDLKHQMRNLANRLTTGPGYVEELLWLEENTELGKNSTEHNKTLLRIYAVLQVLNCYTDLEKIIAQEANSKPNSVPVPYTLVSVRKYLHNLNGKLGKEDVLKLKQFDELRDSVAHFGLGYAGPVLQVLRSTQHNNVCACPRHDKHKNPEVECGVMFFHTHLNSKEDIVVFFKDIYEILQKLETHDR